jgi:hypothetical protein
LPFTLSPTFNIFKNHTFIIYLLLFIVYLLLFIYLLFIYLLIYFRYGDILYIYKYIRERGERGKYKKNVKKISKYINMEFKLKKLTAKDLLNLEKIYNYLELNPNCLKSLYENTRGKNNYHARKIGALNQREARGATAGVVIYRGELQISKLSLEHPDLDELLIKFMKQHNPKFIFNSVYITKNCVSKPHVDAGNIDTSIIVTIGTFTGGGLYVIQDNLQTILFDIKTQSLQLDGRRHPHYTQEFSGTRYSLIFY